MVHGQQQAVALLAQAHQRDVQQWPLVEIEAWPAATCKAVFNAASGSALALTSR